MQPSATCHQITREMLQEANIDSQKYLANLTPDQIGKNPDDPDFFCQVGYNKDFVADVHLKTKENKRKQSVLILC